MMMAVPRRATLTGLALAATLTALGALASAASAAPTLGLTATSAEVGQTIQATAELTESPGATGTISFELFGPGDEACSGSPLAPAPASVSVAGEGEYDSGTVTPATAGDYRWSAEYRDELDVLLAEADCAALSTVAKATPSLTGSASAATVGGAIRDEAALTGGVDPTGAIAFSVYAPGDATCLTPLETDSVPLGEDGKAIAPDFVPGQAGEFRWIASYAGDANNEAASTACGDAGQSSTVSKAVPALAGVATSAQLGQSITDNLTISGGFQPTGELLFRAFGPDDPTCSKAPAYEAGVSVAGNSAYAPAGFAPPPGLYLWTVSYSGDANNQVASSACGADGQSSAIGTLSVRLLATATNAAIGGSVLATATLADGATPSGQLSFRAFAPSDLSCSGGAIFTWTVTVAGNGVYGSAPFIPTQAGAYRWTVAYSGDANHSPAAAGCGVATSTIAKATPTIAGKVNRRVVVGQRFRDFAILSGGHVPGGTITFSIYAPGADSCAKPAFVNTVPVTGNGVYASDPFVANRAGAYRFVATYSGDGANHAATEPCGSIDQRAQVRKRTPRLRPRGLLADSNQISIRARLAGAVSPAGVISFRLYGPGDRRCARKPLFAGSRRVKANGTFPLAEYIATRPGAYRLAVGYSGDPRNARARLSCTAAQRIAVR